MKKKKLHDPFADREAAKYQNPIPSRELISQVLEKASGPLTLERIAEQLNVSDEEPLEALRRRLKAMVRDGQLLPNRKREFGLIAKMDLVRGRVQGHRDGFGFLVPKDGGKDIFLTHRQMQKVFDGDEVLVSPGEVDFKGRQEGKIIEVLERHTRQLVGRICQQGGASFVRPDNPRYTQDIIVAADATMSASSGQFVVVEITQFPDRHQRPEGKVVEVLGDHMAPGMEIDVAIRSNDIPHVWPADVEAQAKEFTEEVKEQDKQHRVDLRHLPFVTIDGEDARDFDDAVYCENKRGGGWRLYVAIADVSHYVKPKSALDNEALVRGNSVYFPDYVVPMLPQVLSNGLCSLNPHIDRLCMVCEMTISVAGKISSYKFYEGLMHSHARLTYTKVGKMIEERENPASSIRKKHEALLPYLDNLYDLYLQLRKARGIRGAIDFDTNETRILFDEQRKIEKIVPVERNDAHKLIEECMLAANVCTAKFLQEHKIPALYRVHEGPSEQKRELLLEFLQGVGIFIKASEQLTPQDYCQIMDQVGDRPDAHLIQMVMLRSMNQARYQPENQGHFGLAYSAYTHFTSPIRRYPDLLVHRAIRAVIRSDIESKKVQRVDSASQQPFIKLYPYSANDMLSFGEQCSVTERRADEATRDVVSWLKCEYLREHVGESFGGVVSAVTSFGLFVELNDIYIEGLVHITSLPHDYYRHEVAQHRLVGERSRREFGIGDALRVQVASVNLDERKIDFDLISPNKNSNKKAKTSKKKTSQDDAKAITTRKVRKRPVKEATETKEKNGKGRAEAGKTKAKKTKAKTTPKTKVKAKKKQKKLSPKVKAKAKPKVTGKKP
ncbi:MAG: ribonuclease R [Agarilytica sp.]